MSKSCSSLAFAGSPDLSETALHRSAFSRPGPFKKAPKFHSFGPVGRKSTPVLPVSLLCAQVVGILTIVIGAAVLAGWWLNIEALKGIVPGAAPLKPNVGAGFLLSGGALTLLSIGKRVRAGVITGRSRSSYYVQLVAGIASVLIALLGGLTLAEYFMNWDLKIDRWLMPSVPAANGLAPGRMNPVTALGFLLVGTGLLFASPKVPARLRFPLAAGLGAAASLIGILPLTGFVLEALFGQRFNFLGMSLSGIVGATSFLMLGAGMLALIQSHGGLNWSLGKTTTIAFVAGVLLTSLTTASAFNFARRMLEINERVTHRHEVLKEVQACKADVAELLNSQRAYVILGEANLLSDRAAIKDEFLKSAGALQRLTADNPRQQQRLDRLNDLFKQRLAWEERVIGERQGRDLASAAKLIGSRNGIRLSEAMNACLKEMETAEHDLLGKDRSAVLSAAVATFLLLPFGVFVTLAVLTLAVFFLNSGVAERVQSETALRESQAQLGTIVENLDEGIVVSDLNGNLLHWNPAALKVHGYTDQTQDRRRFPDLADTFELSTLDGDPIAVNEWPLARILRGEDLRDLELCVHRLGTDWRRIFCYGGTLVHDATGEPLMAIVTVDDITERKQAEQEIIDLNIELENRVIKRTAELEATNKELEAFSYSVSHDLRAPLRAVDGFSQAVLEDYGQQLPAEGRHYLDTIRQGAQRMGTLIDDLLTFSRLSRLPLIKQEINTAKLVGDILEELCSHQKGRQIEKRIGDLPPCHGDPALLKQVWINLLSNALKYTNKREQPVIEIGSTLDNGDVAYFVADNGVGFDMQYAHKLFGVFQRLHRAEEFEGTGVGLAIVQRVVNRHGGRIWAKAEPERGASFYFTLGKGEQL